MQSNQSFYAQGKMLGRYRMQRILGRGGMGEVWLAEDSELHREVTVKLLPVVLASDEHYLHAFEYEARAAAALEHPHILAVHDFGEERNGNAVIPYLVLPYITGGSLRDRLRKGKISVEESLEYLRQAAEAIDFAHSQRVLHRDIKPANMLLQDRWLFLADFGLAKLLSTTTKRSSTHTGAGTPEYMAPEQAQGHAEAASDRYSLAMTAYQLLTGNLPFRGETPYDILIKQVQQQAPSPRSFNPLLPEEIEGILLRGLAKRSTERPASCIRFVQELSVAWSKQHAKGDAEATVLAPWSKRLREHTQSTQLPFSVTPAPTRHEARSSSVNLNSQVTTTRTNKEDTRSVYQTTAVEPGRSTEPDPSIATAEMLHTAEPVTHPPLETNRVEATNPSGYSLPPFSTQPGMLNQVRAHEETAHAAPASKAMMSRRSFLAAGGTGMVVVAAGGIALYTALRSQRTQQTAAPAPGPHQLIAGVPVLSLTGHSRTVWDVAWDPTGRYLATGGEDHSVMLWDIGTHLAQHGNSPLTLTKPLRSWRLANAIGNNALSWSPNGRGLVVTAIGEENKVHYLDVFSTSTNTTDYFDLAQAQSILQPTYWYTAWSPQHNYFATALYQNMQVVLWQQGKTTAPLKILPYDGPKTKDGIPLNTQEIAWSADGTLLAGTTNDFRVIIWDIKTGKVKQAITLPDAPGLHPTGKVIFSLRGALEWSPIASQMLAVSNVNVVSIWDVQQNKQRMQLGTDDRMANTAPPKNKDNIFASSWNPNVTGVSWSPNGRYILGGYGRSHRLYTWDLQARAAGMSKDGIRKADLIFGDSNGHTDTIVDVAWSPDGRYVASSSFDSTVIVWKVDGAQ